MSDPEPRFHFRVPAREDTVGAWLARLFPEVARRTRRAWVAEGRVRVDGHVQDRGDRRVPPGARVSLVAPRDETGPQHAAAPRDEKGSQHAAAPRDEKGSQHAAAPRDEAGSQHAAAPRDDDRRVEEPWLAWIVDPPWWRGALSTDAAHGTEAGFEVEARVDDYARVRVAGDVPSASAVLEALARIGLPVVGDLERGGLGLPGGPRIGRASAPPAVPDEPVWCGDYERPMRGAPGAREAPSDVADERADLHVSDETARVLGRGHPWIRPDAASDATAAHRPGALVRILDRRDRPLAWARIEDTSRIAARVWATEGDAPRALESVESRVARALARRASRLYADPVDEGNALRLIHGEADGLPGLFVDRLGALLRVLTTGAAAFGHRDRTLAALRRQLPVTPEGHAWSVLELLHLRDAARGAVDRVRFVDGGIARLREAHPEVDARGFVVRERGLDYFVDPGWDAPRRPRPGYGLFLDQRDNRDRVAARARPGGRWLNLFAHTGAFSVALLAAGAASVTSIDLSAAYLERLEANLERNRDRGVDPGRHRSQRGDVRRALERLAPEARFEGIVLDPPTAAAAGRRFWSVRDDLEPLLATALARLEPGGHLLVTQNRAGPPLGLERVLERLARRAHRPVERIEPAPPATDHPSLRGFPEGDPFEGVLLDLR